MLVTFVLGKAMKGCSPGLPKGAESGEQRQRSWSGRAAPAPSPRRGRAGPRLSRPARHLPPKGREGRARGPWQRRGGERHQRQKGAAAGRLCCEEAPCPAPPGEAAPPAPPPPAASPVPSPHGGRLCGAGRDRRCRTLGSVGRGFAGVHAQHRERSMCAKSPGKGGVWHWAAGPFPLPRAWRLRRRPGGTGRAGMGRDGPAAPAAPGTAAKSELRGIEFVCYGNIATSKLCLSLFRAISFFTSSL